MTDQPTIPGTEPPPAKRKAATKAGPVYQGVCATIRRLTGEGQENAGQAPLIDAALWAGTIAQARSLARSIDNVDGRDPLRQANGVPLSAMHEKLDALLARLNPEAAEDGNGVMDQLLAAMEAEEARQRDRATATPHTEE